MEVLKIVHFNSRLYIYSRILYKIIMILQIIILRIIHFILPISTIKGVFLFVFMAFLLVDFANYLKKNKDILKEATYLEFSLFLYHLTWI